jgi:hypothetical protein
MATRTYKPQLLAIAKLLYKYITKWQVKLEQSLGESGYALLVAVLDAVILLIGFLEEDAPEPGG